LVLSINDPTEVALQKMIEASQKMINEELHNPAVNEHFKLQIKTLQHVPREEDKSCKHFESKTKGNAEAGNTHGRHSKVGY
jgi:hypothetical protein